MSLERFRNKKVALLGAGVENLGLLPHLLGVGAQVTICNRETDVTIPTENVAVRTGENYLANLGEFDYIFRIPGMPVATVDAALAHQDNKPIRTSAIDLFLEICPAPVIGVTGTKGKGTTSTLIASILEATGKKVFVGANINRAVFSFYEEIQPEDVVVLELSSFQLEDVAHSPHVAVLLPITQEHLQPLSERSPNFHASVDDYVAAKAQIAAFQTPTDLLVYASDNSAARSIAERSNARRVGVGREGNTDIRVSVEGEIFVANESEPLIDVAGLGLAGEHLFLDSALAVAVAQEFGATAEQLATGIANWKPLPHRLQRVGEYGGVTYYNDSYATAPDATVAALTAFSRPVILIAGGSRKGVDFSQLADAIRSSSVKLLVLIGQEKERIAAALKEAGGEQPVQFAQTLEEAVTTATQVAASGDVVLLSPACASKDMFKDAADRGEQFMKLVSGTATDE